MTGDQSPKSGSGTGAGSGPGKSEERRAPTDEELDATPPLPLVVWAARCASYFLALGGIMLVSYAVYGFDTDPNSFPPGFRLNPLQAAVNFVWGLAGTLVGFFRPRHATAFVLAFAAFYTVIAGFGTFEGSALGMHLGTPAKIFYWVVVAFAWTAGLYALLKRSDRP
ncbi:hypothetical protein AUC68_14975 [Methyloceanibacter methanicus]|uniref:Uncharacterized protein n=1 Tax=Methyloceanibacter methanicus TaxID=1774968 RepID=A0A1E3W438_9HYPH|nr:hypothetical protein [Methyloceanibacter methanicus]ODS00551.1 hypothetical protein AUC68_14975 [Methyloceanibacter methanicus]